MSTATEVTQEMFDQEADRRVLVAVAEFDTRPEFPVNWRQKINISRLNFGSSHYCILGQIFKDNPKGLTGFDYGQSIVFADKPQWSFLTEAGLSEGTVNEIYLNSAQLKTAWQRYLEANPQRTLRSELALRELQVQKKIADIEAQLATLHVEMNALIAARNEFDLVLSVYAPAEATVETVVDSDQTNEPTES